MRKKVGIMTCWLHGGDGENMMVWPMPRMRKRKRQAAGLMYGHAGKFFVMFTGK